MAVLNLICKKCGGELEARADIISMGETNICVIPCEYCIDAAVESMDLKHDKLLNDVKRFGGRIKEEIDDFLEEHKDDEA